MRSTIRTAHATRSARSTHRSVAARRDRRVRLVPALRPLSVVQVECGHQPARAVRTTRITRRGRVVVLLALVALLFAAFSYGRAGTQAATVAEPRLALVETTVQPGESLWTVAQRIAPETDPREVVQQIRRINDLSGSGLQAGQQLLLPA
jgi:LysM domain